MNPNFKNWYTDLVDIYRVASTEDRGLTTQSRTAVLTAVPCRMFRSGVNSPSMTATAARVTDEDKLALDIDVDVRAGDELLITRGGAIGHVGDKIRCFAGRPHKYYDPVARLNTGLTHQEVGLLEQNITGEAL